MAERSKQPIPLSVRLHVPLAADLAVLAENIASLRAREVELVFAEGHPIVASMASLRTLKNAAAKAGKGVCLVTNDPAQARLAERAGWKVVAEAAGEKMARRLKAAASPPPRHLPLYLSRWQRRLWLGFALAAALLAAAVGWLVVPGAVVTLRVKTEPFVQTLTLSVLPPREDGGGAAGGTGGQVVAEKGKYVAVWTDSFPVRGRRREGTPAKGWVKLINRTGETVPIRQHSRLTPEGKPEIVLRTQKGVHIPAGGGARVEVVAERPGSEANLPAGAKLYFAALPESARSILFAEVVEGLKGGEAKEFSVVTDDDAEQARERLLARARDEILKVAREKTPATHIFLEPSLRLRVASQALQPQVGSKAEKIEARLEVEAEWWTLSRESVDRALRARAERLLGGERMFLAPPAWPEPAVKREEGKILLQYALNIPVVKRIDLAAVQEALAARSRQDALRYLQAIPGVQEAELELRPPWRRRLPPSVQSIEVRIEAAGG